MRAFVIAAAATIITATPLSAQTERGYVNGLAGFTVTADTTSTDVMGEVGVRIAPRFLAFGDLGRFRNLRPSDVQAVVDNSTIVAAGHGLLVDGTAHVPAWYSLGGVRYEMAARSGMSPYVVGGIGFARLIPSARFTFSGGRLADGSTPPIGADVTSQVLTAGDFAAPSPTIALMFSLGGGVNVPVARHWAVDVGYRFSRVNADTPLNAHGATFGLGWRF